MSQANLQEENSFYRVCPKCKSPNPQNGLFCQNCGQHLEQQTDYHALALKAGMQANQFYIVRELGLRLDNSRSYLAEDENRTRVLLKQIKVGTRNAAILSQAYEILAVAQHKALPRVISRFELKGDFFLAVEWKAGGSFATAWRLPGVTEQQRLGWIKELGEAMQEINLHNAALLELKPAFLILMTDGGVALQDFSLLARLPLATYESLPPSYYLAPEIYTAPQDVSQRAAVYTLGATWLSLLVGKELEPVHFQKQRLLTPAELLLPTPVTPSVNRLISRALHPSLEKRYKSPAMLIEAIEQAEHEMSGYERRLVRMSHSSLVGWSDCGMERDNNEDSFFAQIYDKDEADFAFALIADGMGGEAGGEIASALAVDTLSHFVPKQLREISTMGLHSDRTVTGYAKPTSLDNRETLYSASSERGKNKLDEKLAAILGDAINAASHQIFERASTDRQLKNMGCTVVAFLIINNYLYLANVGDSRAYIIRQNQIIQISQDHTRLADLRRRGNSVSVQEAEQYRGILSRNLGYQNVTNPFFATYPLQPDDYVLLCCDGLTDGLTDQQILTLVYRTGSKLLDICYNLINAANQAGGHDNVTVVLYHA